MPVSAQLPELGAGREGRRRPSTHSRRGLLPPLTPQQAPRSREALAELFNRRELLAQGPMPRALRSSGSSAGLAGLCGQMRGVCSQGSSPPGPAVGTELRCESRPRATCPESKHRVTDTASSRPRPGSLFFQRQQSYVFIRDDSENRKLLPQALLPVAIVTCVCASGGALHLLLQRHR